jgi:hypothetical protein
MFFSLGIGSHTANRITGKHNAELDENRQVEI